MSHRGPASSKHSMPPNPKWIEFENSDGDESLWPTNTTEVVDREGHVNYMRPAALDESLSIKWRVEVAKGVAKLANWDSEPAWVLKAWPSGYRMFDHNKGPRDSPRHDAYLMGSTHTSKFRSVPEFIPHAYWLLLPDDASRPPCQCKYCSKSGGQRAITMSLGLLPNARTPSISTPSPTPSRRIAPPPRINRTRDAPKTSYAAIRKKIKPPVVTQEPRQVFARDRNADLRAAYGNPSSTTLKRWYREGELLWCVLSIPIKRGEGEEDSILFWPGVVEEVKFKTAPINRNQTTDGTDSNEKETNPAANWRITAHPSDTTDRGPVLESAASPSWTVHQYHLYKIKLLAVSQVIYLPDEGVLPYQAYVPSDQLLQAMRDVPHELLDANPERMQSFNPCPAPPESQPFAEFLESYNNGQRFFEAAAPYSIAMQIASGLAGAWSLTDEWEYKFNLEATDTTVARSGSKYPGSLHEVLAASMANNAAQHSMAESASAGPSSRFVPAGLSARHTVVQKRYQGLWWGTERIWTDDVVRLKVARRQIAPQGAENIYKPAGPSQKTIDYNVAHGFPDPAGPEFDASGRGVFMRIEGIYLADIQRAGGAKGEIRVSGMLYELADADWDDPEEQNHLQKPSSNGVGENNSAVLARTDDTVAIAGSAGTSIQSILANPDPAASTTPRAVEGGLSPHSFHNGQLSHPRGSEQYPMPPPPTGFKLRPILPPGHEVVVDLTFISGRYYPRLLAHPLLQSIIDRALRSPAPTPGSGSSANEYLWAMEGLSPGCYNSVDPIHYKKDRGHMLRDADKDAREALQNFWQSRWEDEKERRMREEPELSETDKVMEVDM
ncbi:hypothetical protein HWV62_7724 [Athelia sp. TMB]|nr:hypothetical protein HWV62_7724 [Athelia sp. TMB]